MPEELLYCYNKGCGQKYKKEENKDDSCTFHPGAPVFHDAYKSWSCCKKKSSDFTEFLNMKGCTTSFHSNEKPPEREKPVVDKESAAEVVEVRAPLEERLPRPPLETPMITLKPTVAPNLVVKIESPIVNKPSGESNNKEEIAVGTLCKHGGCKHEYLGAGVDIGPCVHHPGVPVFHEGLKFWSCCTRRTTNFATFLEQEGCVSGDHQWTEAVGAKAKPACRYDWHQTGSHVIISVYAKKYDPNRSTVQVNPIRAKIDLLFPQDQSNFSLDLELKGVIDVNASEVSMLATKVELKMRKAEPGSWSNLAFPKPVAAQAPDEPIKTLPAVSNLEIYDDDPVDLDDIQ